MTVRRTHAWSLDLGYSLGIEHWSLVIPPSSHLIFASNTLASSPMSIATRTGDNGSTGLMYNRRVPKNHPRVESYGAVDELNTALGLARATAEHDFVRQHLLAVQHDLVILMGELATLPEDLPRYVKGGFTLVTPRSPASSTPSSARSRRRMFPSKAGPPPVPP